MARDRSENVDYGNLDLIYKRSDVNSPSTSVKGTILSDRRTSLHELTVKLKLEFLQQHEIMFRKFLKFTYNMFMVSL